MATVEVGNAGPHDVCWDSYATDPCVPHITQGQHRSGLFGRVSRSDLRRVGVVTMRVAAPSQLRQATFTRKGSRTFGGDARHKGPTGISCTGPMKRPFENHTFEAGPESFDHLLFEKRSRDETVVNG